ncbi:MAG: NAD(+) synthase [Oscillospiraceae bacterium]|nr:NAD(+) synthase [Oscillospiraceae bacterium]
MNDGFIRTAAATIPVRVADCKYNADRIIEAVKEANGKGCSLLVFPELCITGYTCGDLFLSRRLQEGAVNALFRILKETADTETVFVAGLPVVCRGKLYNCAAVCLSGKLLGIVPKSNIPNYSEFYEARYFASYTDRDSVYLLLSDGENETEVQFGRVIYVCEEQPLFRFAMEICEDLWVTSPPSVNYAEGGALIICNPSASDEVIGKKEYRKKLCDMQSARLVCGYIYADCGLGESTQDMVFSGHSMIYENGALLSEAAPFSGSFDKPTIIYADIDLEKLSSERLKMNTFPTGTPENKLNLQFFEMNIRSIEPNRYFPKMPFVPANKNERDDRCREILTMQAAGLATRLRAIGCKKSVIGLSGGLDSTLALIVTVRAFDMLDLNRSGIIAVTMPCFGTTSRTKSNALILAESYGAQIREINISETVRSHFADIGQSEDVHDVTYENAQARERTQVIMDIANQTGGIVIGTGDLSELALGWATYNGDHMSMYGVNASVPKTLVRHLVDYEARQSEERLSAVLRDILDTPVSPELLPPDKNGEIAQKTEDLVGPYELHDFFLYYTVRFGFTPKKILRIAKLAFKNDYSDETIEKWLRVFIKRFFTQQFKRSCLPDGPKVGSVTLSPRGDWRMPSDASANLWLDF